MLSYLPCAPPLPCQRGMFALASSSTSDLHDDDSEMIYLNCAARSPLLKSVATAGHAGVDLKVRPWHIGNSAATVEEIRRLFGQIIGATADDIALMPSTAFAVSTAAANLELVPGRHVLVLEDQMASNVYPWQHKMDEAGHGATVRTVLRPSRGAADATWTSAILDAIDDSIGIVAVPNCHW